MKIKYISISCLSATIILISLFMLVQIPLVSSAPDTTLAGGAWVDEFDSSELDSRWSWVREDPTHWSLTAMPGYMRITTQLGGLLQGSNSMQNLLLTEPTLDDYLITTKVNFDPVVNVQTAALYVYQEDGNYIYFGRRFANDNLITFRSEVDSVSQDKISIPVNATNVYLRLAKKENVYLASYSTNGSAWTEVGQFYVEFSNPRIGLSASSGPSDAEIPADFDYFRFEEFDQSTLYVAPSAECAEAKPCYGDIQAAVDAAAEFDLIKVAAGTYSGVSARPRQDITSTGVVTQVVYISKSVDIQGGFTTADWNSSDPEANQTIVDAKGLGRAFYITGDIYPIIEGLRITGGDGTGMFGDERNNNDAGGGIYIITATVTIQNNWIYKNSVPDGSGGGLYLQYSDSNVRGNEIYSNTASAGGGINTIFNRSGTLSGNKLTGNIADDNGGGMYLYVSSLLVKDNLISGNYTQGTGGGIATTGDADTTMVNNVIIDNRAIHEGTALHVSGGRLYLLHNTITGDTSVKRSAVKFRPSFIGGPAVVTMTNNIVANSETGIIAEGTTTVTVDSILWYDVKTHVVAEDGAVISLKNENTGDPAFAADGYHLTESSAAVDKGIDAGVTVDIDGDLRPALSGFDLGADEFTFRYVYLPILLKQSP